MTRIEDVNAARIAALEEQGMSHSDAAAVAMAEDRGTLATCPACQHLAHDGRCPGFANCGCEGVDEVEPTCDICGEPMDTAMDGTENDAWPEEIESVIGPQRTDQ